MCASDHSHFSSSQEWRCSTNSRAGFLRYLLPYLRPASERVRPKRVLDIAHGAVSHKSRSIKTAPPYWYWEGHHRQRESKSSRTSSDAVLIILLLALRLQHSLLNVPYAQVNMAVGKDRAMLPRTSTRPPSRNRRRRWSKETGSFLLPSFLWRDECKRRGTRPRGIPLGLATRAPASLFVPPAGRPEARGCVQGVQGTGSLYGPTATRRRRRWRRFRDGEIGGTAGKMRNEEWGTGRSWEEVGKMTSCN